MSTNSDVSKEIVRRILDDLTDWRGLRQEWEGIDSDIQDEIRKAWRDIIDDVLYEATR